MLFKAGAFIYATCARHVSFFKILIDNLRDNLCIPPMAAVFLPDLTEKNVYLQDVNGYLWNVKLAVVNDSLAFQKGWQDFLTDHSIMAGEFLVITYTGGLVFEIRIFGVNSLERTDFPLVKKRLKGTMKDFVGDDQTKNDSIAEFLKRCGGGRHPSIDPNPKKMG